MANYPAFFNTVAAGVANAGKDLPSPETSIVVIIGFGLVFCVLALLVVVLSIEGKIFSAIDKKKNVKNAQKPANVANVAPAAPAIEQGVPQDVVAAIMAAVMMMENSQGTKFELKSITRAKTGRSAWNMAGTVSYTEPF